MKNKIPTLSEESQPQVECMATPTPVSIVLLTGGFDRPYAYGLAMALIAKNVRIDVIGSDAVDSPEMHVTQHLTFVNLWPVRRAGVAGIAKVWRTARHYASLIRYAATAKPRLFHILWNSKVQFLDRTLLMLYYKGLGKKVTLTAHNVNQDRRDSRDSWLNRFTLRIQYRLADHIFVHTQKMKRELVEEFGVADGSVTVIRHPINNAFPDTNLNSFQAKQMLKIDENQKTILCFGKIKPYKGIENLLAAFQQVVSEGSNYRLIIAGEVQKGNEAYMDTLQRMISSEIETGHVLLRKQFIPDDEMEVYLKAADVLVLPYNEIFQSGVLFLSYSFGLPVIATDVGSFREEIVEGRTGYLCRPADSADMAKAISKYFASDLYRNLDMSRQEIKDYAAVHHSWHAAAELSRNIYRELLEGRSV